MLADSLIRTIRDADTRRAIADGRLCLCTPYKPDAGFSVANAMGRNKLIYALSQATVVVAADEGKGGTWAGAVEALTQQIAPVIVRVGESAPPGNGQLARLGAISRASVQDAPPAFRNHIHPGPTVLQQLALSDVALSNQ